jgi:zinc transport system substrate-binding protein
MRILFALLYLLSFPALAEITIVTSIKPLQQLTSAIMQGAGEPQLLIKHQISAHHFAFKPSHFSLINQANLIIWISRDFESGFHRLPEIMSKKTTSLELLKALDLAHEDGHIWYSPVLLPRIANQILRALNDIDPANAAIYQRNTDRLIQSINLWAATTRADIAKVKPRYMLDHNFLSHFEHDFGIEAIAVLHDSHDQHGGIQQLQTIESALLQSPVKCLLINESAPSKLARNFAVKFKLDIHKIVDPGNVGSADGEAIEPAFISSLNRLSSIMQQCH